MLRKENLNMGREIVCSVCLCLSVSLTLSISLCFSLSLSLSPPSVYVCVHACLYVHVLLSHISDHSCE